MPLGDAISGAATGWAAGGPIGAGIFGLAGLAGLGHSHTDPQMERMRKFQQGIADQQLNFANSVPGSDPSELANMAQSRGMLGQQERQQQQRVFSNYNPNQGLPAGQMLANLSNANIAREMSQHAQFLQDATANRRQALQQAAGTGMNAAQLYQRQPSAFSQIAGPLAQGLAYQQAKKKQNAGGDGTPTPGDTPTPGPTGADLTGAQQQGPAQPIDWAGLGASGELGSPASTQGIHPALHAILVQSGWTPPGTAGGPPAPMPMMLMGQGDPNQGMLGPLGQPGAPGPQGAAAPGNGMFGINGQNNQLRQSNQLPPLPGAGPQFNPLNMQAMLRSLTLPGGVRLPY